MPLHCVSFCSFILCLFSFAAGVWEVVNTYWDCLLGNVWSRIERQACYLVSNVPKAELSGWRVESIGESDIALVASACIAISLSCASCTAKK